MAVRLNELTMPYKSAMYPRIIGAMALDREATKDPTAKAFSYEPCCSLVSVTIVVRIGDVPIVNDPNITENNIIKNIVLL